VGRVIEACDRISLATWEAPPLGIVKLNSNASIVEGCPIVLASIVSDEEGCFSMVGVRRVNTKKMMKEAEVEATLFGLRKALEVDYNRIILGNSYLGLLSKLQEENKWSRLAYLLKTLGYWLALAHHCWLAM